MEFKTLGRRKERGKFYEVLLVSPAKLHDALRLLRSNYRSVLNKGKGAEGMYVIWVRDKK